MRGEAYIIRDPEAAAFLVRRYGLRVVVRYQPRMAEAMDIEMTCFGLHALAQGYWPASTLKQIFLHPKSNHEITRLPGATQAALVQLGILPEKRMII